MRSSPGDEAGLTDALRRLVSTHGEMARLGSKGHERVAAHFNAKTMVAATRTIYEETRLGAVSRPAAGFGSTDHVAVNPGYARRVRTHLISLGRQSLVYGLSGAVLQLVGLVTLPVYARQFSPAEYGVIELASVTFAALIIAVDAGLGAAMQREYFDTPDDDHDGRVAVTSTATTASVALATVIAVPMIVAREPLAQWLFRDSGYSDVVVIVALSVATGTVAIFLRDIMRLRFQPWRFAVSALVAGVVAAVVGVTWVVWFDGGVSAVMAGFLAGQAASAVYGLSAVRGFIGWRFSLRLLRRLAAFGLPLVPAGAALWGVAFVDRVLLARLDGLASVGEYAVGTRFASVLFFVVGAFGTAYIPFLYSTHAEEPERELALRARILTYGSVLFVGLALALALSAREIAAVIAPDFTARPRSWESCVSAWLPSDSRRSRVLA